MTTGNPTAPASANSIPADNRGAGGPPVPARHGKAAAAFLVESREAALAKDSGAGA